MKTDTLAGRTTHTVWQADAHRQQKETVRGDRKSGERGRRDRQQCRKTGKVEI